MNGSTNTSTTVTIQPAQGSVVGQYDVRKPLPYPWHVRLDGTITHQELWRGDPDRLCGFQRSLDEQTVYLFEFQWLGNLDDVDSVVGSYPVFMRADGSMWTDTRPVESVTVNQRVSA